LGDVDAKHSEQLAKQIDEEIEIWHSKGIDPSNVNVNAFMLDQQVHALFDLLIEMDIITREELDYAYRKKLLPQLQGIRKELEPQLARAKIQQGLPKLFGPNGEIMDFGKTN
jgi:hypothetical protein